MKVTNLIVVVALLMGDLHLRAQNAGVEYTSELQTNLHKWNHVNLLRLNGEMPISKSISLQASTISIAKTREESIVNDLQTFSNIEEENLPFAIAVCGVSWTYTSSPTRNLKRVSHSIYMGIRNINEDYFTSPVTSFFTNSSCGIFPTISANYPIANYPMASVGIHYCYDSNPVKMQASLYNGTGYSRFTGRENVFRVCPKGDDVFGIAQVEYQHKGSCYFFGASEHYGKAKGKWGTTWWTYAEQRLTPTLSLLAGYSHAFAANACSNFLGIGGKYSHQRNELAIYTDIARFTGNTEYATEITSKINFNSHLYVQPTVHAILTGHAFHTVATLRLGVIL